MSLINNTSLSRSSPLEVDARSGGSLTANLPSPWSQHQRVTLHIPPHIPGARVTHLREFASRSIAEDSAIGRSARSKGNDAIRSNIQAISANARDPRVTPFNLFLKEDF